MKEVSITEMSVWQECQLKWWYKYRMKLRLGVSGPMTSGSAIHSAIEAGLLGQSPLEALDLYLLGIGPPAERYRAGCTRALAAVPEWVWTVKTPQVEDMLRVEYDDVTVIGKPDLWWVDGTGIHVIDFKSTSDSDLQGKIEAYSWSPQLARYAALIHGQEVKGGLLFRGLPIYTQFVVVNTMGRALVEDERFLSQRVLEETTAEMVALARDVGRETPHFGRGHNEIVATVIPHWGYGCHRCEFKEIDEVRLTGGDWEAKMQSQHGKEVE